LPKEISEGRKGVLKECAERMRLFLFLRGYYSDKIIPCISSSSKTHAFVHCPIRPSDHPSYHRSTERMEKQESRRGMPAASKYPNSRSIARLAAPLRVSLSDTSHRHPPRVSRYCSLVQVCMEKLFRACSRRNRVARRVFGADSCGCTVREVAPRRGIANSIPGGTSRVHVRLATYSTPPETEIGEVAVPAMAREITWPAGRRPDASARPETRGN